MIREILAETMISGEWLTGLAVAVIGAVGSAIVAYKRGAAAGEMTLKSPVPTVPTSKVSTPPTWDAHRALCDRVLRTENETAELRKDIAMVRHDLEAQYREILKAGSDREQSISDKLDGIARGIHHRIDELMQPKRSTRP